MADEGRRGSRDAGSLRSIKLLVAPAGHTAADSALPIVFVLAAKQRITSIIGADVPIIAVQRRTGDAAQNRVAVLRTVADVAVVLADQGGTRDAAQNRVAVLRAVANVAVVSTDQRWARNAAQDRVAVLRTVTDVAVVSADQRWAGDAAQDRIAVLWTVADVAVVRADQRRAGDTTAINRIAVLRTVTDVAVVIADYRSVLASALAKNSRIIRIKENFCVGVTTIYRARIAIVTSSHWVRKGETASSSDGIIDAVMDYTGPRHTSRNRTACLVDCIRNWSAGKEVALRQSWDSRKSMLYTIRSRHDHSASLKIAATWKWRDLADRKYRFARN